MALRLPRLAHATVPGGESSGTGAHGNGGCNAGRVFCSTPTTVSQHVDDAGGNPDEGASVTATSIAKASPALNGQPEEVHTAPVAASSVKSAHTGSPGSTA